jgi:hypothetical protein
VGDNKNTGNITQNRLHKGSSPMREGGLKEEVKKVSMGDALSVQELI